MLHVYRIRDVAYLHLLSNIACDVFAVIVSVLACYVFQFNLASPEHTCAAVPSSGLAQASIGEFSSVVSIALPNDSIVLPPLEPAAAQPPVSFALVG